MLMQTAQKIARKFGYELVKQSEVARATFSDYPCIDLLDLLMQDYVQTQPNVSFLQIGAHDGISADPASQQIRKHPQWRGILVEPQPISFQQLCQNYQGEDRFIFENLAIGAENGTLPFYTVREDIPDLPFWLPQSASFDRQHVLGALHYWKHVRQFENIPDDLESVIVEVQVPTMTIQSLLAKHQMQQLDLLVMATPGFDYQIIKSFPFELMKPSIICFEYFTLTPEDREACLRLLADLGYSVGRFAVRAVAALNAPTLKWTISEY
jgi:FkbM family methyltransferase